MTRYTSSNPAVAIRHIRNTDLDAVNKVIASCVMAWDLPERVKRLSLNSYLYHAQDLDYLGFRLAETPKAGVVGIAAWEPAAASDSPQGKHGILLHGLYVAPSFQHRAIGSRLVGAVLAAVREQRMDGLLVKAQAGAVGFFRSQHFVRLPVENPAADYPHRWWKPL